MSELILFHSLQVSGMLLEHYIYTVSLTTSLRRFPVLCVEQLIGYEPCALTPTCSPDHFCKNMRYLFSFDLIPYSVIAPSSISGLLHHMPYF